MRVVVVSPHRDDAAFSLGLAIDAWLARGHRVEVLNCFTLSEYAPYSDVDSLHANDKRSFVSAVRRREDVAWNKLTGSRLRVTDLDMLDAPLRLACPVEEVLTAEIRPGDRAVARVAGALRKLADKAGQAEIAVCVPLALGEHIDHRVVHQAALEALREAPLPVAFYEDLPYAARPGVAATIASAAAQTGFEPEPCFAAEAAADEAAAQLRKRRLADCYDSQIDGDVVGDIASFAGQYGGRERVWGNAAWLRSPLVLPVVSAGSL